MTHSQSAQVCASGSRSDQQKRLKNTMAKKIVLSNSLVLLVTFEVFGFLLISDARPVESRITMAPMRGSLSKNLRDASGDMGSWENELNPTFPQVVQKNDVSPLASHGANPPDPDSLPSRHAAGNKQITPIISTLKTYDDATIPRRSHYANASRQSQIAPAESKLVDLFSRHTFPSIMESYKESNIEPLSILDEFNNKFNRN